MTEISWQTGTVPFQPKQRADDVDQAIQAFLLTCGAVREAEAARKQRVRERAQALERALSRGATLAEIAKRLDVSAERVRQMRERRERAPGHVDPGLLKS